MSADETTAPPLGPPPTQVRWRPLHILGALDAVALSLPTTLGAVLLVYVHIGSEYLAAGILAAIAGLVLLHLFSLRTTRPALFSARLFEATTLAEPNLSTRSGEPAVFFAGGEFRMNTFQFFFQRQYFAEGRHGFLNDCFAFSAMGFRHKVIFFVACVGISLDCLADQLGVILGGEVEQVDVGRLIVISSKWCVLEASIQDTGSEMFAEVGHRHVCEERVFQEFC